MKNLKRLIALVAVFALALTTVASAATFTDVAEDSAYYEAVETLSKLGIIDGYTDGTFKPEQVVTRAEMAKLIATMQGLGATAEGGATTKFSDVPASHWASGYIANATGVAINGRPDGTFAPDAPVKYEEAVKMIMATLGYTVIANGNGGYPGGYVSAAIKEKVTENVSNANVGTEANRGTIAQLIYNAIDTPLVEQTTWEADGSGEYKKYDGVTTKPYKTLMSENLDVVKMKGVVTASAYTAIADTDIELDKDEDAKVDIAVTYDYKAGSEFTEGIDDDTPSVTHTFLVGDTDVESYVGMAVIFFAMEDDYDNWEVISVAADSTYNKAVSFDIANYDDAKTDATALYYFKDGASKSTKIALEDTISVVFNNVHVGDVEDLMDILGEENEPGTVFGGKYSGTITAIDNDNKTGYDVVIIESAASAVVDSVEDDVIVLANSAICGDGEEVAEIDTDDDNLVVVITKDGKEIAVEDVNEDDVVSIIYAENGTYMIVDVMSNVIEGTVSSKKTSTTSANGSAYKIDGTWYDVAAGCTIGNVKAGDTGVFYVDKYGKIAYYDKSKSVSGNYAYVVAENCEEDAMDGITYQIKLLTANGVKTYTVADKYKFNADGTETTIAVKDMDDGDNNGLAGKLIDVTFSGEYIKGIVVEGADEEDSLSAGTPSNGLYDAEDVEINGSAIDKDAIVFFVEMDGADFKSSESYVGTLADLADSDTVSGKAYTTSDDDEDPTVLVLVNATASVNAASNIAVIVDVEDATNEDEEDILAIKALYNGETVELTTTADVASDNSGLAEGDVVKVRVNSNNVVTAMALVTNDIAGSRRYGAAVDATIEDVAGANETIVGGYATAIKKDSKKLTVDGTEYNLNKFDNIYVVDYTGRDLDIKKGSSSSYKFEERFFDASYATKNIYIDDTSIGAVADEADQVADYVIIRHYDGNTDVYEAVIVKGASYKVK